MTAINRFRLSDLTPDVLERLMRRSELDIAALQPRVQTIIEDVRARGDVAVVEYTQKFDGVHIPAQALRVTPAEFEAARQTLVPEVRAAIEHASRNIRAFHEKQKPPELWWTEVGPGVLAGEKTTPIPSAGLYVPRGKGSFPSVVMMLAIPAHVAGVPRLVIVTPPGPDGQVDAATLVAAQLNGVEEIYKVGGVQAVAALAYGTETIPRVYKILGPGGSYVTAAKHLLYSVVDVGLPAGPSESIVLADASADPHLIALDLLVEAEHGPDSAALLVTDSPALVDAVAAHLPALIAELPEPRRSFVTQVLSSYGGLLLCDSFDDAVAFCNDYAPEHLMVHVREPFLALRHLHNAGEILLGALSTFPLGNYCLGTNAVLPTGGFARTYSALSIHDFLKRTGIGYVTAEGFGPLAETAAALADYEGFPAHARAVRVSHRSSTRMASTPVPFP